jgi:hypothetical protein
MLRGMAGQAIVLCFEDKGTSGRVGEHEQLIVEAMSQLNVPTNTLALSADLQANWIRVRAELGRLYRTKTRPLRVAVDLNSVPRYLSLALLGYGARSGLIEACEFVYSSALRYSPTAEGSPVFTAGNWEPFSIPAVSSGAPGSSKSHLIVSAGFEGLGTRRLVNALEPDLLSVVVAAGVSREHTDAALNNNAGLVADFLMTGEQVIECPALDVSASIERIAEVSLPTKAPAPGGPETYSSFLLCGPKTVALAMALIALDTPIAHVYYVAPEKHVEHDVAAYGESLIVSVRL